ncbi:MAG: Hsp20/alpha crystallin family protein [Agriterribacter sp.]
MTNMVQTNNRRQPAGLGNVVDQVFQNTLSRIFDDSFWGFDGNIQDAKRVPVNIRETENSYEMELVAPGLQKQDFNLQVSGNLLTVSFEEKQEQKEQNDQQAWVRREFFRQPFTRSFTLDDTIDVNRIEARYENGILYLALPKNEKAKNLSRTITIE